MKAVAVLCSLWTVVRFLPRAVVALRVRIFAAVNGQAEVTVPGPLIGADQFEAVYGHPAAGGRSEGAALSDLFWYWLAPGAHVHQEHLEDGPRYQDVAATTKAALAVRSASIVDMAARCAGRVLDELAPGPVTAVRLRDLMMPIWAEFFYELVFAAPCPPDARDLVVGNADDVVTSLKCTGLRHMDRRDRLTRHLMSTVDDVAQPLPSSLSRQEQAFYLQGTYFNTAVVQMSEAMAHLLLAVAQHAAVQDTLTSGDDERYLDHVIEETFRMFPLFGIAHRITTDEIVLDDGAVLDRGTVLCFDYAAYERTGYDEPHRFDPSRWDRISARTAHHIPFGVAKNRPCPAWRLAPIAMRAVTGQVLARFRLASPVSHTRSIPHRAPCLLMRVDEPPAPTAVRAGMAGLWARDKVEDVWRSVVQLGLGTWMVLDARRRKPCATYFAEVRAARPHCPAGHAGEDRG